MANERFMQQHYGANGYVDPGQNNADLTVVLVQYPASDLDPIMIHDVREVRIRRSHTIDIYFDRSGDKEGGEYHLPHGTLVKVY